MLRLCSPDRAPFTYVHVHSPCCQCQPVHANEAGIVVDAFVTPVVQSSAGALCQKLKLHGPAVFASSAPDLQVKQQTTECRSNTTKLCDAKAGLPFTKHIVFGSCSFVLSKKASPVQNQGCKINRPGVRVRNRSRWQILFTSLLVFFSECSCSTFQYQDPVGNLV